MSIHVDIKPLKGLWVDIRDKFQGGVDRVVLLGSEVREGLVEWIKEKVELLEGEGTFGKHDIMGVLSYYYGGQERRNDVKGGEFIDTQDLGIGRLGEWASEMIKLFPEGMFFEVTDGNGKHLGFNLVELRKAYEKEGRDRGYNSLTVYENDYLTKMAQDVLKNNDYDNDAQSYILAFMAVTTLRQMMYIDDLGNDVKAVEILGFVPVGGYGTIISHGGRDFIYVLRLILMDGSYRYMGGTVKIKYVKDMSIIDMVNNEIMLDYDGNLAVELRGFKDFVKGIGDYLHKLGQKLGENGIMNYDLRQRGYAAKIMEILLRYGVIGSFMDIEDEGISRMFTDYVMGYDMETGMGIGGSGDEPDIDLGDL